MPRHIYHGSVQKVIINILFKQNRLTLAVVQNTLRQPDIEGNLLMISGAPIFAALIPMTNRFPNITLVLGETLEPLFQPRVLLE